MNKIDHNDPLSKSTDIVSENIQQLQQLFPEVFKEGKIDWQELQATLGEHIDAENERFSFTWNGKSNARKEAQKPSTGTLRPAPEESVDWDTTQNLYIEGDNLEVLKLLQKSYHQKVKMIYIDPPYNTGKDFVYKDNYKDNLSNYLELTGQKDEEGKKLSTNSDASGRYHSNWLNMMYPRLKLARNLLKDDGVIFISIDDNESCNLKKLCNEIFGEENFVADLAVQLNPRGRNLDKFIAKTHESLLIFTKNVSNLNSMIGLEKEGSMVSEYNKNDNDGKGAYRLIGLRNRNQAFNPKTRPKLYYPLYINTASKSLSLDKKSQEDIEVFPDTPDGIKTCWTWGKEKVKNEKTLLTGEETKDGWRIYRKDYLKNEKGEIARTLPKSVWLEKEINNDYGRKKIKELIGKNVMSFPKSTALIKKCLMFSTLKDDIILDFFSGSGTTADAIMQLNIEDIGNRKHIQIQLPEPIEEKSEAFKAGYKTITEIGKDRIRKAATKLKEEHPDKAKDLDLGFKVFKLDSSNIKAWSPEAENLEQNLLDAVENIKEGRTENDLLFEILLKYGLDLTLPITEHEISGVKVFNVGAGALLVCLADNITVAVAEGIAELKNELKPEICRVVFKDNGFKDSSVKTNVMQKLKQHNIEEVRSI